MAEKYYYTLDPFPQETEYQNRIYKFYDFLKEGRLTSTKCKDCGFVPWPPRVVCPKCMSDNLEWIELPEEGEIYAFTVQESGVPMGFKAPLIFAMIKIGEVRFLSRIVDANPEEVKVGGRVKLKVLEVPNDRVLPAFALVK
jgi:hypothetical protein